MFLLYIFSYYKSIEPRRPSGHSMNTCGTGAQPLERNEYSLGVVCLHARQQQHKHEWVTVL